MPDEIQGIKEGSQVPLSDNIEITELHCHDCDGYIKFAFDKGKFYLKTNVEKFNNFF